MSRVSQDVEPTVGLDFRRALPVATGTVMVLAGYSKDSQYDPTRPTPFEYLPLCYRA